MKKTISLLIALLLLAAIAYVLWTFKVYIITASFVIVLGNLAIEGITGKKTRLTQMIER